MDFYSLIHNKITTLAIITKNYFFIMKKLLLACLFAFGITSNAQISVNESFEGTALPAGWTSFSNAALSTVRTAYFGTSAGTPCLGTKQVYVNTYGTTTSQNWYLVYSSTASTGTPLNFSAKYQAKSYPFAAVNGTFSVEYSIDGGTSWVNLVPQVTLTTPVDGSLACTQINGTIPAVPTGADFKLKFNSSSTGGDYYMGIDDVKLEAPPSTPPACATALVPADMATAIPRNPVLTWMASSNPSALSYDVYFGTATTPPFVVNQTSTSYTPPLLLANTTYYWKIVPKNAIGDNTGCAVQSFTTGTTVNYCDPSYTTGKTDGDLISKVEITEGLSSLLSNDTGTSPTNPAYTYFSTPTATLQAGNTYNVTITVGTFGSQNVAVWIDYNDNGIFETNERVGYTTASIGSNGTASFPITLACNPPLGTHRMRVRDVYGTTGNLIDPCNQYGYGETEDYDVTVSAAVACPAPSAGVAENITSAGATLKWNIGCSETQWDVNVAPAGSGVPTGAPTHPNAGPNTGFVISSGLTPTTDYEFYVRANCGSGSFSTWAGPYNFSTQDLPPANDNCANADVLQVNADLTCINVTASTTSGATASTQTAPTCLAAGANDDVWFKFTATSAQHRISLLNVANFTDMAMAVYSGACGSLTQLACSDPNTLTITGLSVGVEYYVRVWTVTTTYTPTAFEICVGTPPPPPANDACSTATVIPAIAVGTPYNDAQDATSATNNSGAVGCSTSTYGQMNDGVWYSIVGDGTTYTVNVTETGWDSQIDVYTGSCGSFSCIASQDSSGSSGGESVSFATVNGVTYYINLGYYGTTDSAEGPYTIAVSTNGILGTNENALQENKVKVYPNPFSDILNISDVREVASVSITDMAGRLVKSITKPTAQLQLGDLKSGLYLVTLKYKDGSVKTVKTVKK